MSMLPKSFFCLFCHECGAVYAMPLCEYRCGDVLTCDRRHEIAALHDNEFFMSQCEGRLKMVEPTIKVKDSVLARGRNAVVIRLQNDKVMVQYCDSHDYEVLPRSDVSRIGTENFRREAAL